MERHYETYGVWTNEAQLREETHGAYLTDVTTKTSFSHGGILTAASLCLRLLHSWAEKPHPAWEDVPVGLFWSSPAKREGYLDGYCCNCQ